MHRLKFFTLFLVFGLLVTLSSDPAHSFEPNPDDGIIAISLLATERSDVEVGSSIEIYLVIKNFSNFTMNNVTVTQFLDTNNVEALQFIESPIGLFNGTDRTYTENVSVINYISGENVTLNSFTISSNNFTLNMGKIDKSEVYSFRFSVNITESGRSSISETTVTYYDQFGDLQDPLDSPNDIEIRATAVPTNEKDGFFPEIEVEDVNYRTVFIIAFVLLAVALLSRSLYKKRPIE